jgi:tetratricopeptide (TPR) repeat protein
MTAAMTGPMLLPIGLLLLALDARTWFEQGVAHQKAGRLREAERSFSAARKIAPDNFAVLGNLGVVHAQLGEYEQAIAAYREALKLNPSAHRLRLNIGIAGFKRGSFSEAAQSLEEFLKAEPENAQARELLALSLFQIQRYEEAETLLLKLVEAHGEKLSYLYALGQAQVQAGDRSAAEKTFQRMFALFPGSPETHLLNAQALMAQNQHEKALEALQKAEQANSALPGLWLWKGIVLEGLGRTVEGRSAYAREISSTGDPIAYYAAGILENKNGSAQDAARLLLKALPIDSERYNVSYYLARAYTRLQRYPDALKYANISLARDPESSANHNALLAIYRGLGRSEDVRREPD